VAEPEKEVKEAMPESELPGNPCVACDPKEAVKCSALTARAGLTTKESCFLECVGCSEHHVNKLFARPISRDKFYDDNAVLYPFHEKHEHMKVIYIVFF